MYALPALTVQGAIFTGSIESVTGPGAGDAMVSFFVPATPNNDDGDDPLFSDGAMAYGVTFERADVVDVLFRMPDSGGVTEYTIFVDVVNQTPDRWIGFALELGFGSGSDFVLSGVDGLSFDTDETDPNAERNFPVNAASFASYRQEDNRFLFLDGFVSAGFASNMLLAIDVSDSGDIPPQFAGNG